MKTIHTQAIIGPDRRLVIEWPGDVEEGVHQVTVTLSFGVEAPEESEPQAGMHLEWENGLLVYTGPVAEGLGDNTVVGNVRQPRLRQILYGIDE